MKKAGKTWSIEAATVEGGAGREVVLSLSGQVPLDDMEALAADIRAFLDARNPAGLTVDLGGVTYLDSAGALALVQLESDAQARSISCRFANVSEDAQKIMGLIDRKALATPPLISDRESAGVLDQIGEAAMRFSEDLVQVLTFLGDLLFALAHSFLHPRSVRWGDVFFYMKRAGADGLPIVGLIGLLMGLIIAFMSSLQLKQFGANIYVASLLAISMVKELGPIMTAILVAGRSGSAFAAEIGTMMVNEEVDALVTMGFEPVRFLAVPKVLAALIVVPLLTIYADLFGILGGLIVGVVGLDLTAYTYIQESRKAIDLFNILTSLFKSAVFAVLIAGIGCQRGFMVRGGAQAVGAATTSAVVAAIFLIIVTDSAFALVLHYVRG
ncbi:MAG: MlaE family lipid ABC transporter permease subunit [Deltaproteobacteria bacterium]|nr:MAG: MlaE family lipid ABC transporter permease subunit [Deltaproteobacteria bacterium]